MLCLSQLQIAYCNRKRCLFHNNSLRGALSQENETFFDNWSQRRREWGRGWLKVDWAMYIRRIAAEIHPYCFNHSDTLSGRSIPLIFWWQILFYPPECVCKYSQMGSNPWKRRQSKMLQIICAIVLSSVSAGILAVSQTDWWQLFSSSVQRTSLHFAFWCIRDLPED